MNDNTLLNVIYKYILSKYSDLRLRLDYNKIDIRNEGLTTYIFTNTSYSLVYDFRLNFNDPQMLSNLDKYLNKILSVKIILNSYFYCGLHQGLMRFEHKNKLINHVKTIDFERL